MVSQAVVVGVLAAAVGLLVGGLIGHFGTSTPTREEEDMIGQMKRLMRDGWKEDPQYTQRMLDLVNPTNIKENLRELTKEPHLAGTPRDDALARMIHKRFQEAGFDTSELVPYNLLLSRPDPQNPNLITLWDAAGQEVFRSHYKEVPLQADDDDPNFVHAFNSYTPAGSVETRPGGGVVYVNYGRVEDFDYLETLGVNVSGNIAIARYGKIFRGNKLQHAQERGAVGLIIFSDPKDVALEGVEPKDVYPNSWWLPGSGVQRGTTKIGDGDPLTPGWPSTADAYRLPLEEAELPKIPCQPIGYDDARVILEKMGGAVSLNDTWKGGLTGVEYNLGPDFLPAYNLYKLRLTTHNTNGVFRNYNVIGTIRGEVEPDRYVLIGNHRDAWGYGASDPSSGTAQLLETARVMGELRKEGWRPRRTLVFCSWGAEEYGLIGSTEWVEQHVTKLQERAVMYLNTDTCVSGPILHVGASPLLRGAFTDVTKMIPGVVNGATLYDEWAAYHLIKSNATQPEVKLLGSGSDHAPFSFYCGIPAADVWFRRDQNKHDISIYPAYHTGYETFYMVDTHLDPEYKIHQGCSRLALLTLRHFSDSAVLPYSLPELPSAMTEALKTLLEAGDNHQALLDIYDKLPLLQEALDNFTESTTVFVNQMKAEESKLDPIGLRALNDQLMKLEQVFVLPAGLPGRPTTRHAIFAPSQFDSYSGAGFPGLTDLLYKLKDLTADEMVQRKKDIRRHVSDLTILVQTASSLLVDYQFI